MHFWVYTRMKNDRANDMNGHLYVTYRFMKEIVVTNESEWAEHMYVMFACYVLFKLLCINSFSSRLDM